MTPEGPEMDTSCALSGHTQAIRRFTGIDKRTRAWRRRAELIALFIEQLGGQGQIRPDKQLEIERCADLVTLAETKRAEMLAGGKVDIAGLTRLENSINRAKWFAGLAPRRRQTNFGEREDPLGDYLKTKMAP